MLNRHLITILTIVILATPMSVQAVSLSELNVRIAELLARVFNLKSQIANVQANPVAEDTSESTEIKDAAPADLSCLKLDRNIAEGDKGFDVTKLQLFLARNTYIYPEAIISGYFGRATRRAVQRFQISRSIASYGPGYGVVGPKTRADMRRTCPAEVVEVKKENIDSDVLITPIEAAPIAGGIPFDSVVRFTLSDTCVSYLLDWGDGTVPHAHDVRDVSCDSKIQPVTINHVYPRAGVYTVVLRAAKEVSSGQLSLSLPTVSYKAIVAGGTVQPFSLTPTSGPAPMSAEATFTLTHPSCTSYSVDWGDGKRDEFSANTYACSENISMRRIKHIYTEPGTYDVSFRKGFASIANLPVIERWIINVDPIGKGKTIIELSDTNGKPPLTVQIKMAGTDGYCTSYDIDWGDGSSSITREWIAQENSEFSIDDFVTNTKISADGVDDCSGSFNRTFAHTYVNYGVYPLRIKLGKGALQDIEMVQHFVSVSAR